MSPALCLLRAQPSPFRLLWTTENQFTAGKQPEQLISTEQSGPSLPKPDLQGEV